MRRRLGGISLAVIVVSVLAMTADAHVPSFVKAATYSGTTSQHGVIRVHVASDGKTATMDAGARARCSGRRHYAYGFHALFHHNPARVHGSTMSVHEIDRNHPRDHQIPATKIVTQDFNARATGNGHTLAGSYRLTETLTDGRHCETGTVRFSARTG